MDGEESYLQATAWGFGGSLVAFSKTISGLFVCFPILLSFQQIPDLYKRARSTAPGDQSTSLSKKTETSAFGVFHLQRPPQTSTNEPGVVLLVGSPEEPCL